MSKQMEFIEEKIKSNKVMIFSKTGCPFCVRVKELFKSLGVKPTVEEINRLDDCDKIQSALQKKTGGRTVPRVFIGGEFIGGCDETYELNSRGELVPKLKENGVL